MLRVVGAVVRRKQYDRVPMADEDGKVTVYVMPTMVDYVPTGGTAQERRVRAARLAAALNGEVVTSGPSGDVYARTHFDGPSGWTWAGRE